MLKVCGRRVRSRLLKTQRNSGRLAPGNGDKPQTLPHRFDAAARRAVSKKVLSRIFRTFVWAARRPTVAQAVMAPLICWSFSSSMFRYLFVGLCWLFPDVRAALAIIKPDTVIRWHRMGFRAYWRWKAKSRGGRPPVPLEVRQLIRDMSLANPLWGAPRIHGELLKLGIDVGQTSVAKYMARRRGPPSQGWKTFLRNHADGIAAMDLFVVPKISFRLLYGL